MISNFTVPKSDESPLALSQNQRSSSSSSSWIAPDQAIRQDPDTENKDLLVRESCGSQERKEKLEYFIQAMAHFDKSIEVQIQALQNLKKSLTECVDKDKDPCKIEEGLFLGSVGAANNKDALKHLNVTHVLIVASILKPAYPDDFMYKVITAKRLGGGVLVHCFIGKSRSVTIVVAYLMKKHGMSLSQALEHVKSQRPQASPNSGFISQLEDYEKFLQGGGVSQ
ncbi:hypothetical protein EUGRSUZ_B01141 [Eucalyptus grandis]|uniref:protein-tyrosine-phosphatase n=2 Tax=Eucalyptus grandis TaxID=71139 RepID=A0A059D1I4_EUCGR|nr:hypothetical protein EUGRSUZ_B01141 [Eucalyptus grandis]